MVLRSIENVVRVEGGKMNGEGKDEEREMEREEEEGVS
jgi:hypothetical protein